MAFKLNFSFRNIKKWRKALAGVFNFLTHRAFFLFLILLVIGLLLGVLVFYHYTFFSEETIEGQRVRLELNKGSLEQALRQMQDNQQRFDNADTKAYDNLFK